jgi:hypothetical protein
MARRKPLDENGGPFDRRFEKIAGRLRKCYGLDWNDAVEIVQEALKDFFDKLHNDFHDEDLELRLRQWVKGKGGLSKEHFFLWRRCFKNARKRALRRRSNGPSFWPDGLDPELPGQDDEINSTNKHAVDAAITALENKDWQRLARLRLNEGIRVTEDLGNGKTRTRKFRVTLKQIEDMFGWDKRRYEDELRRLFLALRSEIEAKQTAATKTSDGQGVLSEEEGPRIHAWSNAEKSPSGDHEVRSNEQKPR